MTKECNFFFGLKCLTQIPSCNRVTNKTKATEYIHNLNSTERLLFLNPSNISSGTNKLSNFACIPFHMQ